MFAALAVDAAVLALIQTFLAQATCRETLSDVHLASRTQRKGVTVKGAGTARGQ